MGVSGQLTITPFIRRYRGILFPNMPLYAHDPWATLSANDEITKHRMFRIVALYQTGVAGRQMFHRGV